jgi:hypothetical protein
MLDRARNELLKLSLDAGYGISNVGGMLGNEKVEDGKCDKF